MTDQLFDKVVYALMAAVLVVPEPITFVVCALISAGVAAYCASFARKLLRRLPSLRASISIAEVTTPVADA